MAHPFGEQTPLTGAALKTEEFQDFAARLAAYRDEAMEQETERHAKALERFWARVEMEREKLENDHKHAKAALFDDVEMRQELTERRVEFLMSKGAALPKGVNLASWHLNGKLNSAYDRKQAK